MPVTIKCARRDFDCPTEPPENGAVEARGSIGQARFSGLLSGAHEASIGHQLLRRHVEVRLTVQRTRGGWAYGTPKTERSSRDVPMRRELLEAVATFIESHPERHNSDARLWPGRVQGGFGESKSALDFERQLDITGVYKHYFIPAAREAGLVGLKWHSLRHTYASLMAGAGIDIYKVSRWMGHSNVAVTDGIYTHLFATDPSADMDRLDAFLATTEPRSIGTGTTR